MVIRLRGRMQTSREVTRAVRVLLALAVTAAVLPLSAPSAEAAPGIPVLYEQTDTRLQWSGPWSGASAIGLSGGSHALTNSAGSTLSFAFCGTQVDLLGVVGPKYGIASVSVDGEAPASVDLYATTTALGQTVLSVPSLAEGLHTVTLRVTGTRQTASTDAYVSVDAVRVYGELAGYPVEQADTRIVTRGSWATSSASGFSGGSQILSNVVGDEVAIAFSGTQLDLVGAMGPKFGIASVSVDGAAAVDVDLYGPSTTLKTRFFSTGALGSGPHTVTITCSGRKSLSSADTFVALDAVLPTGALTQAFMRYEEIEPRLAWNGQLSAAESGGFSGGRYVWAGPAWGACAVSWVGCDMRWVAVTGPQYGIASVSIDGGAPVYVDLYSADVGYQRVVYNTGTLAYGTHNAVISWTGTKNPAATGTYVSYDAFDLGGVPVQALAPQAPVTVNFSYPWVRYIVVDKSDLRLYYVVDGALVKGYPVATGKLSTPTPSGIWRIGAKYYTDPWSVYGPRKMRLFRQSGSSYVYTAYAIHGTNVDSSVGTYASHGCVRMHNYDVLEFFDMVPLGTMVVTRD